MATRASKRRKTGNNGNDAISISDESSILSDTGQLHEVAHGGDLVVQAGVNTSEGYCVVKVHSFCLKLASPVFRAMLESSFAEGTTSHTEESPLRLPDDHGPAFLEMCKILHHQPTQPRVLALLPNLVILADKYQCLDSIRAHVQSAVAPYYGGTLFNGIPDIGSDGLSMVSAMCIACVIKDAQLLRRTSAVVLVHENAFQIEADAEDFEELLPTDLIGESLALYIGTTESLIMASSYYRVPISTSP